MSFGKLYGYTGNSRSTVCLVVAKLNNLDIEFIETPPPITDEEYIKINPMARVPAFVGKNGWILTEVMAVAIYFAQQDEKTTLLGNTKEDFASVIRWMSFFNSELLPSLGGWFRPILGWDPYREESVENSKQQSLKKLHVLENFLAGRTFLVGEDPTLADVFGTALIARGFQFVLDSAWSEEHPNTTRWFKIVTALPMYKAVVDKPIMIEEAIKKHA